MSGARKQEAGGGAAQPAEASTEGHRIALDGQAYTWQEFKDYYGNHAWRKWQNAWNQ